MTKYLITYHGSRMPNDPAVLQQSKIAFGRWLQEAGKAVIDPGAPVHMVSQVSNVEATPAVDIGGYSIVEAPSLREVKEILKNHPFVGRGGTLQVNEIIAI